MEDKIVLDRETFKALAADSRIKILKLLEKRRHTQSELSFDLELAIPTIKEHLVALEKASLVKMADEGYKWKYYEITEKGKCVLDPERKKIWIVLASLGVSVGAGLLSFMFEFTRQMTASFATEAAPKMAAKLEDTALAAAAPASQVTSNFPVFTVTFALISLILIVILSYYMKRSRMFRKKH